MPRSGSLRAPDVPAACVRCGTPYGLTRQPLRVPGGSRRVRYVDVPFCPRCWRMHESTRSVVLVATSVAAATFGVGGAVSVISGDWVPAVTTLVVGLGILLVALVIRRRALPVQRRTGEAETVIDVPTVGDVRIRIED